MAEQKENSNQENFVSKIIADPKNPSKSLLLTGYLGPSSEEGCTRLYFDAQLSRYVEIPDSAILHSQKVPDDKSALGLGESYVWINPDAELIQGPVGPNRARAKFLEGPIAQEMLQGAQFGGAAAQVGGGQQPTPVQTPFCPVPTPSAVGRCPSQPQLCPGVPTLPFCPTETSIPSRFVACNVPTVPPYCPRVSLPFCPTETGCPSRLIECPSLQFCPPSLPVCPTEACPPSRLFPCQFEGAFGQAQAGGGGQGQAAQPPQPQQPGQQFGGAAMAQPQQQAMLFGGVQNVTPAFSVLCPRPSLVAGCPSILYCPPSAFIAGCTALCTVPVTWTFPPTPSIACGFGQGGFFGPGQGGGVM